MNPAKILEKASSSKFHLWLLNQSLYRMIPFNKPHRFKITKVEKGYTEILLPYRRSNLNHIKGIHACALATCAEYVTGFTLLTTLPQNKFRIIMKEIKMEYFYQAKMDVIAKFELEKDWVNNNILQPLSETGSLEHTFQIQLYDKENNHIATGSVLWHLKSWEKVKTKV